MSRFTEEEREGLKRRWEAAQKKSNDADYEKASIMKVVLDRYAGKPEGFRGEIKDGWKIYDNQKVKAMLRMARAVTSVPDRDVWLAIGLTPCAWLMENMNPEHYRFLVAKIREKSSMNNGVIRGAENFIDQLLIDAGTPRPRRARAGEDKELARKIRRFMKLLVNNYTEGGVLHAIKKDQRALQLFNEFKPRRRIQRDAS